MLDAERRRARPHRLLSRMVMVVGVTQGERRSRAGIGWLVAAVAVIGTMLAGLPPGAAAAEKPTRYSIVGGCYALRSESPAPSSPRPAAATRRPPATVGAAEPFRMQATDLGRYLFYGTARDFLAARRRRRRRRRRAQRRRRLDRARERRRRSRSSNEFAGTRLAVGARRRARSPAQPPSASASSRPTAARSTPRSRSTQRRPGRRARPPTARSRACSRATCTGWRSSSSAGRAHCGKPWHRFGAPYALRRLRRPRGRRRLRRGARERPLRQPGALPRPGRLADLQRTGRTTSR